jgi:uncharacterized membrane protein
MLMLVAAAGLALLLLHVDRNLDPGTSSRLNWAYTGGPEGARSLLSTIAGSMITAASVTFSLASVALSIASQQYGSRVLRNFMRDRITQVLLGTFVATFIYCVLVVRAIRGSDVSGRFVPAISVTCAIASSLISLMLLIYFIHHVSASIQASHIIRVIAEELEAAIPELYPSETGSPAEREQSLANLPDAEQSFMTLETSGYLQTVDLDTLLELACEQDLILRLLVKPGDHLLAGDPVAEVSRAGEPSGEDRRTVLGAFYVGRERTPAQDIRYHFQQLTDFVVRALSPGINDSFTAVNGIDELAAAMLLFVRHTQACERRQDKRGRVRLIVPSADVGEILKNTVGHIAIYAVHDDYVLASLRRVLDAVYPFLKTQAELALMTQLRDVLEPRHRSNAGQ